MAPRETENNAYAKFLGDKQRALWYMLWHFLEWSIEIELTEASLALAPTPCLKLASLGMIGCIRNRKHRCTIGLQSSNH